MAIYNKYTGTLYSSTSYPIILDNSATQSYSFVNNDIFTNLLDNTSNNIEPKDLRNAILSLWDSSTFKLTNINSETYIGIDSGDSSNNFDVIDTIYFGKRNYKNSEIMTSNLLSNNTDIFLYNTRPDTLISQDKTTISILAGTNTSLYPTSPILESEIYTNPDLSQSLALNILNSNGDINILSKGSDSDDQGGQISINNINFPTYQDSDPSPIFDGSASNNMVLTLNNGNLIWSQLTSDFEYYGATNSILPIYGNPIYINGYDLEFTETMYCPIEIGDIKLGQTFSSQSLSTVLESIIYDYLEPLCSIKLNISQYLEVGTYPNITLEYTITKRTNNTLPTSLINMLPNTYQSINSSYTTTITETANGIVPSPLENNSIEFKIVVSDGINTNSATTSISGVYPLFYGFSTLNTMNSRGLLDLTKLVDGKSNKILDFTGSGNLYFIYDASYGTLSSITDNNNNDITSNFTQSTITLSSPTGLWASKLFNIYMWSGVTQIGPPSENFYFNF
jgi:hypothetical protein